MASIAVRKTEDFHRLTDEGGVQPRRKIESRVIETEAVFGKVKGRNVKGIVLVCSTSIDRSIEKRKMQDFVHSRTIEIQSIEYIDTESGFRKVEGQNVAERSFTALSPSRSIDREVEMGKKQERQGGEKTSIADVDEHNFRWAVGMVQEDVENEFTGVATGFLITPNLFMTCEHVFRDGEGNVLPRQNFRVVFNDTIIREFKPEIFEYMSDLNDFAIIALEALDTKTTLNVFARISNDENQNRGCKMFIIGYPDGKPLKRSKAQNIIPENLDNGLKEYISSDVVNPTSGKLYNQIMIYNLKAKVRCGLSGSPIFNSEKCLLGMHQGNSIPKRVYESNGFTKNFKSRFPSYGIKIGEVLNEIFSEEGEGPTTFENKFGSLSVSLRKYLGTPFPEFSKKI